MTSFAIPVQRGCGSRQKGGVYFETAHGPGGKPVEFFLIDSPLPVPAELNLSSIGVQLVEFNGVYHLIDVVGKEYYPNVADFVEEVRRFGVSRRLPSSLDFSKITPETNLYAVHDRAIVKNTGDWFEYPGNESPVCPKGLENHPRGVECCAWVWWNDVEGGHTPSLADSLFGPEELTDVYDLEKTRIVRAMPSFTYRAHSRPEKITPNYERGFFARFPIGRLVVVKGEDNTEKLDKVRKAHTLVEEVDE